MPIFIIEVDDPLYIQSAKYATLFFKNSKIFKINYKIQLLYLITFGKYVDFM